MPEFLEEEDIDFSDLEKKYEINPDDGFETFIIVDGTPVVPESKTEILSKVLKKKFSTIGKIKDDGFYMPVSDGMTKGFVFIEYETAQQAVDAVIAFHGKKLDQKHTFLVNKLADVERYGFEGNVPSEYTEPEFKPFVSREHLRNWLTDPQGRDQFLIQRGPEVEVFWNKKSESPEPSTERPLISQASVRWSPKGTYLVTFQPQGIELFGGKSFSSVGRFAHREPKAFQFSPNENFLVTVSERPLTLPTDPKALMNCPFKEQDEGHFIVVWDVKTSIPLRTFPMLGGDSKKKVWPIFKWSSDDKYFARVIPEEGLSIYEAPSMGLLDKKSIKIPGIMEFEFGPAPIKLEGRKSASGNGSQVLCYWTPELPNQTARVSIMEVPSKEIIRSRNLFNVSGCRLHWQDEGKYLCVKVDRHTKTKKSTFTNLEFFRLTDKDIPVEVVELKDTVINFAWEPKSDRFVTISRSDSPAQGPSPSNKNSVSFYAMERSKGVVGGWRLLKRLEKKSTNSIYWCPTGRFVVTANVGGSGACELDFFDYDHEGGEKREADKDATPVNWFHIGTSEHYGMTDLQWDPSGRYIATYSSIWRHTIENGYKLWDFRGSLLREEGMDRFGALFWRPRPQSLLSKEKIKEVQKNLKTYSRRFDEEDAMEASEANREIIMRRRKALADWKEWRVEIESKLGEIGLIEESKLVPSEEGEDIIEEIKEEILEEKEEELD